MKGNNSCIIQCKSGMCDNYEKVVVSLYMPLITSRGANLFFLLLHHTSMSSLTLERFCTLLCCSIDELNDAFCKLEDFGLLKSYYRRDGDSFMFEIRSPLSGHDFFAHEMYSRLYLNAVGKVQYQLSKVMFVNNVQIDRDYEEVTHKLKPDELCQWTEADEQQFKKANEEIREAEIEIDFDYETFFRETSGLVFPYSLRSEETLKKIGRLATLYGVSADSMRTIVARCINDEKTAVDFDKMKAKCIADKKPQAKNVEDPYLLSPVDFLYLKQGMPVSTADKKLLALLQETYHMDKAVINVLMEHVLNSTGNKLNQGYVEKVATTWIRQNIDSREKALAAVKCSAGNTGKKNYRAESMKVDDADIDALRAKLFAKEQVNGKD